MSLSDTSGPAMLEHPRAVATTYTGGDGMIDATWFWSQVDHSAGQDGCWPWMGTVYARGGYGRLWIAGKSVKAHRIAFALTQGPIPEGRWVLHSCDNPPCCNPAHLRVGDHAANSRDKADRGRVKGDRHPYAKLTGDQVLAMRQEYQAGGVSQRMLAQQYGVTKRTVRLALRGTTWGHL